MRTIWKYPLRTVDHQTINMPQGAVPLTVQMQGTVPCLWVLASPDAPLKPFIIATHGTGHDVPISTDRYIGTYQLEGGALIFHVFTSS